MRSLLPDCKTGRTDFGKGGLIKPVVEWKAAGFFVVGAGFCLIADGLRLQAF